MKLLSPEEIKKSKDADLARDLVRIKTTKGTISKLTAELNDLNARFEVALSNQRTRWITEELEFVRRIELLKDEIADLEKQLIPIAEEREKANNLMKEAEEASEEVERKTKEIDDLQDLLEEKLDGIHEREQELNDREEKLKVREKAVEERAQVVKNLSDDVTKKLEEYYKINN